MAALSTEVPVGVVGAGTMGAGIAQVAAAAGHVVLLCDAAAGAAEAATARIGAALDRAEGQGRLSAAQRTAIAARIKACHGLDALAPAGLVIEAIVEDLDAKQKLFEALEVFLDPTAILASNTSSLSITALAAKLKRPERVVGLHFFNPAPRMELVEVVRGLMSAPAVVATARATVEAWGKAPVEVRSTPGFIVNRVARPFYGEALRALAEGAADVATIDAVMREAGGFRMGPFELIDLIGLDVNLAVSRSIHAAYHYDPRYAPSLIQREMVDAGRLGRKAGRGFYDHAADAAPPAPATATPAPPPRSAVVEGELGVAEPLLERIAGGGITVERRSGEGLIRLGDLRLVPTDGRSATEWSHMLDRPVATFDLARDYATCSRLALAPADQTGAEQLQSAIGLLQSAGIAVAVIDDLPGLLVMRTVAMLANEAAETVQAGAASAAAVDTAMRLGVNYPQGPLAWAEEIGLKRVLEVLDHLRRSYGEERYRASWLLRRKVMAKGGGSMAERQDPRQVAEAVRAGMYARDHTAQALGITVEEIGPGFARCRMVVRQDMVNGHETCHGGLTFTLADCAFAYACNAYNRVTVALGAQISFTAPARLGDVLLATAREQSRAGRTGVYDVEVSTAEGTTVALFRGTSYETRGEVVATAASGRE